ncbi:MAG: hypothetical protein JWR19_2998 [Pedosphaera sp.]|nr:hypothetical protein [Pedosphaera sp.]
MKKSNDLKPMNPDDFEQQLQRQPLRPLPADWRADILQTARAAASQTSTSNPQPVRQSFLATLLWPCPQAWAGLAAVWLALLALNFTTTDQPATAAETKTQRSPQLLAALREQERMLAELLQPWEPQAAEPPKPANHQPRSERQRTTAFA